MILNEKEMWSFHSLYVIWKIIYYNNTVDKLSFKASALILFLRNVVLKEL